MDEEEAPPSLRNVLLTVPVPSSGGTPSEPAPVLLVPNLRNINSMLNKKGSDPIFVNLDPNIVGARETMQAQTPNAQIVPIEKISGIVGEKVVTPVSLTQPINATIAPYEKISGLIRAREVAQMSLVKTPNATIVPTEKISGIVDAREVTPVPSLQQLKAFNEAILSTVSQSLQNHSSPSSLYATPNMVSVSCQKDENPTPNTSRPSNESTPVLFRRDTSTQISSYTVGNYLVPENKRAIGSCDNVNQSVVKLRNQPSFVSVGVQSEDDMQTSVTKPETAGTTNTPVSQVSIATQIWSTPVVQQGPSQHGTTTQTTSTHCSVPKHVSAVVPQQHTSTQNSSYTVGNSSVPQATTVVDEKTIQSIVKLGTTPSVIPIKMQAKVNMKTKCTALSSVRQANIIPSSLAKPLIQKVPIQNIKNRESCTLVATASRPLEPKAPLTRNIPVFVNTCVANSNSTVIMQKTLTSRGWVPLHSSPVMVGAAGTPNAVSQSSQTPTHTMLTSYPGTRVKLVPVSKDCKNTIPSNVQRDNILKVSTTPSSYGTGLPLSHVKKVGSAEANAQNGKTSQAPSQPTGIKIQSTHHSTPENSISGMSKTIAQQPQKYYVAALEGKKYLVPVSILQTPTSVNTAVSGNNGQTTISTTDMNCFPKSSTKWPSVLSLSPGNISQSGINAYQSGVSVTHSATNRRLLTNLNQSTTNISQSTVCVNQPTACVNQSLELRNPLLIVKNSQKTSVNDSLAIAGQFLKTLNQPTLTTIQGSASVSQSRYNLRRFQTDKIGSTQASDSVAKEHDEMMTVNKGVSSSEKQSIDLSQQKSDDNSDIAIITLQRDQQKCKKKRKIKRGILRKLKKCKCGYVVLSNYYVQSKDRTIRTRRAKYMTCSETCRSTFLKSYLKKHGDLKTPRKIWREIYDKKVEAEMEKSVKENNYDDIRSDELQKTVIGGSAEGASCSSTVTSLGCSSGALAGYTVARTGEHTMSVHSQERLGFNLQNRQSPKKVYLPTFIQMQPMQVTSTSNVNLLTSNMTPQIGAIVPNVKNSLVSGGSAHLHLQDNQKIAQADLVYKVQKNAASKQESSKVIKGNSFTVPVHTVTKLMDNKCVSLTTTSTLPVSEQTTCSKLTPGADRLQANKEVSRATGQTFESNVKPNDLQFQSRNNMAKATFAPNNVYVKPHIAKLLYNKVLNTSIRPTVFQLLVNKRFSQDSMIHPQTVELPAKKGNAKDMTRISDGGSSSFSNPAILKRNTNSPVLRPTAQVSAPCTKVQKVEYVPPGVAQCRTLNNMQAPLRPMLHKVTTVVGSYEQFSSGPGKIADNVLTSSGPKTPVQIVAPVAGNFAANALSSSGQKLVSGAVTTPGNIAVNVFSNSGSKPAQIVSPVAGNFTVNVLPSSGLKPAPGAVTAVGNVTANVLASSGLSASKVLLTSSPSVKTQAIPTAGNMLGALYVVPVSTTGTTGNHSGLMVMPARSSSNCLLINSAQQKVVCATLPSRTPAKKVSQRAGVVPTSSSLSCSSDLVVTSIGHTLPTTTCSLYSVTMPKTSCISGTVAPSKSSTSVTSVTVKSEPITEGYGDEKETAIPAVGVKTEPTGRGYSDELPSISNAAIQIGEKRKSADGGDTENVPSKRFRDFSESEAIHNTIDKTYSSVNVKVENKLVMPEEVPGHLDKVRSLKQKLREKLLELEKLKKKT